MNIDHGNESLNNLNSLRELFLKNYSKMGEEADDFNSKYLRKLLKNWKIKDFQFNENGMSKNINVINDLNKIINKILKSMRWNVISSAESILNTINEMEKDFLGSRILFLHKICYTVHKYIVSIIKENELNKGQKVFLKIASSLLNNFNGVVIAYISHDFLSVIQKTRMIYESHVVSLYLNKYPQLTEAFYDHLEVILYNMYKTSQKISDKSDELPHEKDNLIKSLRENYGDDFFEDYGWTKETIKDKYKRKLNTLAMDVNIDKRMDLIYRITSNVIHANAFSAFMNDQVIKNISINSIPFNSYILIDEVIQLVKKMHNDEKESNFICEFLKYVERKLFLENV